MTTEHKPHSERESVFGVMPHEILWKEICREYAGELIPYELGKAKAELDSLIEQLEAALRERDMYQGKADSYQREFNELLKQVEPV